MGQLGDAAVGPVIDQLDQHVGAIGVRIDAVELAGLDHSPPPNTVSRPCDGKAPYILGQMAGLRHQGNQV